MSEIEEFRRQVGEVEAQIERSGDELADRARKIQECIEAVQGGLVAKTAELKAKAARIDALQRENEELKKLFSRLLAMFETRLRAHLDEELADLSAKVESLTDLARAQAEAEAAPAGPVAGRAIAAPAGAPPEAAAPRDKYNADWFRKVQERVDSLSAGIRSAEDTEKAAPKPRWNAQAYGPPPGPPAKGAPGDPAGDPAGAKAEPKADTKAKKSNVA